MEQLHPCHSKQIPRLNRISGQFEGVKKMIIEGLYCPDILTQMSAIKSAIRAVELEILEEHLNSCVKDAFQNQEKIADKITEIKVLLKRWS